MAITQWQQPIHECQKGEVTREYCYLQHYYSFNGNLKQYAELLQYAYNKQHTPNQPQTNPQFDDFLNAHPIKFHQYDIEKGCPPSHDQLKNWSKGQNTDIDCDVKYSWEERRTSFRKESSRIAKEGASQTISEYLPYILSEVLKGLDETDEAVTTSKEKGSFTPHQAEAATRSRGHVVDAIQKITGEDKDYTVKADVEADIDAKTTIHSKKWNELLEAYRSGRQQRQSTS